MSAKLLVPALALLGATIGIVTAGSAEPAAAPSATARAWAIRITVPGAAGASTTTVTAPPGGRSLANGFSYPADGSVLKTGAITASSATTRTATATATAEADVSSVSIFGGEITAAAVTARASATTGGPVPDGAFTQSGVVGLSALGQTATAGEVTLADWGYASIGEQGIDTSAPTGAQGWNGFVTELHVHLDAAHGGLPAGSDIEIGFAAAEVQTAATAPPQPTAPLRQRTVPSRTLPVVTAPHVTTTVPRATTTPRPATTTTQATRPTTTTPASTTTTPAPRRAKPTPKPTPRSKPTPKPPPPARLPSAQPALTAGPYVFPVYGESSYADAFGTPAPGGWNHGADIAGRLGQPVLAAANGLVFSVGWNRSGGNRLWLQDAQGNDFYYANLSAFAAQVTNGVRVEAGDVIGFMGATGVSAGQTVHLHFELHPASLLHLGYDGAVDPTAYLGRWRRLSVLDVPIAAGWAPAAATAAAGPEPGAFLLGGSDISSADGLDPGSLERALALPPAAPSRRR